MGETKNLHLYDFGIFGRVKTPQNHLSLLFRDPETPETIKGKHWNFNKTISSFANLKTLEIQNVGNIGTGGHR